MSQLVSIFLPSQPSPYCCGPSKMGEAFKKRCNSGQQKKAAVQQLTSVSRVSWQRRSDARGQLTATRARSQSSNEWSASLTSLAPQLREKDSRQWSFLHSRLEWTSLVLSRVGHLARGSGLGTTASTRVQQSPWSEWQEGRRRCSDAQVPSFNVRPRLQAGYSFEHFVPSSEWGISFISTWASLFLCKTKGRKEGRYHLLMSFVGGEVSMRWLRSEHVAERRCWIGWTISFPCQAVGPALVTFASFILNDEPPTWSPPN